jgi:hypothetical protein
MGVSFEDPRKMPGITGDLIEPGTLFLGHYFMPGYWDTTIVVNVTRSLKRGV